MRSKGSRFTLGVWGSGGWGCVHSTSCNRSQLSQPSAWGPHGLACGKGSLLEVSNVALLRFAWQAWHFVTSFLTCGKSFLCGRSNTFAKFSEDALHFSRQAQHFGDHHRHFAWQAQHFRRVLWLVFCESYCQGCLKWWQGANSVAAVAFCETCWKLTEASHERFLRLQIFRF